MAAHGELKGKKVLLVIASEAFQPIEYGVTKDVLEEAGVTVITASDKPGGAVATDNSVTPVDLKINDVRVGDYDGIFLIGGNGAMEKLDNEIVYDLIRNAVKRPMPYGAICVATRILAKANAIAGKQATGWNGDNALLAIYNGHGVTLIDKDVVIHGLLVTAVGPTSAEAFGKAILRVLNKAALGNPNDSDGTVYFEVE
jgi:putative intracellular protease/amidase